MTLLNTGINKFSKIIYTLDTLLVCACSYLCLILNLLSRTSLLTLIYSNLFLHSPWLCRSPLLSKDFIFWQNCIFCQFVLCNFPFSNIFFPSNWSTWIKHLHSWCSKPPSYRMAPLLGLLFCCSQESGEHQRWGERSSPTRVLSLCIISIMRYSKMTLMPTLYLVRPISASLCTVKEISYFSFDTTVTIILIISYV